MNRFKENLKNALCRNDIIFLERNKSRFDINERFEDEDNDTLLLYSLSDAGSNMYRYLMNNGASIELVNDQGETVVHSVVYSGDSERIEELKVTSTLLNKPSNDGTTPLLLSLTLGYEKLAIELIEFGSDVNLADNNGLTPLHVACQEGMINMVKILMTHNADLMCRTHIGNVPIALAANKGYYEIVKILLEGIMKIQFPNLENE